MNKENILHNIQVIKHRMQKACEAAGRNTEEVKLLLATKTIDPKYIAYAIENGNTLIGENKVQELEDKNDALGHLRCEKHFIGHLQSNKIKDVIKYVTCIQTVDSIELAQKIQNRLALENKTMDIFIQVNTSFEPSKFGFDPEKVIDAVKDIATFDRIQIKGLMTIGLYDAEAEKVRPSFTRLRQLATDIENLKISNIHMSELSMGMSGDLETAIAEGSTIIRVGSAIFGPRL